MNQESYKALLLIGLVLAATSLGIMALFSHTIMPGLRKLDDGTFVKSFQTIDRHIVNPIFMLQFFGPLFIFGALAYYAHKHHLVEAKYIYAALVCYLMVAVITMVVNVPLNDGLQKAGNVTGGESAANARAQFNESKWLVWNHIRTLFAFVSVGCASAAVWVSKVL